MTPALKKLGIRGHLAHCTRHTYCTVALMHGVNPAYIASQAGHSVKMLLEKLRARYLAQMAEMKNGALAPLVQGAK